MADRDVFGAEREEIVASPRKSANASSATRRGPSMITPSFGDVVALARLVEPDTHGPIRAGILEDLVRLVPAGLRPVRFPVAADEEAADSETKKHDDDHQPDPPVHVDGLPRSAVDLNRTAVPYATISVMLAPISDESKRMETIPSAPTILAFSISRSSA